MTARVSRGYHADVSSRNDNGRKSLTCGRTVWDTCPRGDLNPHALLGH